MKTVTESLKVNGVMLDRGDGNPVLLLEDTGSGKSLRIPVGPFEAGAIIMELERIKSPRPQVHDIFVDFFRIHGFSLEYAEIYSRQDDIFFCKLVYSDGAKTYEQEIKPADAIAIAIKLGAPVCASSSVMATAKRIRVASQSSGTVTSHEKECGADWVPRGR